MSDEHVVIVRYPRCGHTWHTATIVAGAWWAAGVTPETCAARVYCHACDHEPPMLVVRMAPAQPTLFDVGDARAT